MTESKVLSADEMLAVLRKRCGALRKEIASGKGHIARWEEFKTYGAVEWANERIPDMTEAIAEREAELAALEQAIACLEVLAHPVFEGITHHWEAMKPTFFSVVELTEYGGHRCSSGDTVFGALLAAHKALKESTPPAARAETEDTPHGE